MFESFLACCPYILDSAASLKYDGTGTAAMISVEVDRGRQSVSKMSSPLEEALRAELGEISEQSNIKLLFEVQKRCIYIGHMSEGSFTLYGGLVRP